MSYRHAEVKAPRLTGTGLRLLVAAAENPLTAGLVRGQMLSQAGISDNKLPLATASNRAGLFSVALEAV